MGFHLPHRSLDRSPDMYYLHNLDKTLWIDSRCMCLWSPMNLETLFKPISACHFNIYHGQKIRKFLTKASRPICCPSTKKAESEISWTLNATEWEPGAVGINRCTFWQQVELSCWRIHIIWVHTNTHSVTPIPKEAVSAILILVINDGPAVVIRGADNS